MLRFAQRLLQQQLQQAQDDFKDLSYQQQKYAAELARSQSQYQQVSELWTELKQQYQSQQQDYMQLQREHSALQISLKEKQQHFAEQQALLQNSKQQLSLEFQQLAQQCLGCHGETGIAPVTTNPNLAGQNADYLQYALKAYRDGNRKGVMAFIKQANASSLSDNDIAALALYFSSQTGRDGAKP